MSQDWMSRKRQDAYYQQAKSGGLRSRAYFKLEQMDERFHIFRKGMHVADLGAAPGGWSQYAREAVGDSGIVVAVDRDSMPPLAGVTFIRGDMTSRMTQQELRAAAGPVDVVASDMSPNITGNYTMDQARSVHLVQTVLSVAEQILKIGGTVVAKVFEGEDFAELMAEFKSRFRSVKVHSPPASRDQSSEVYVIARGFLGARGPAASPEGEKGNIQPQV